MAARHALIRHALRAEWFLRQGKWTEAHDQAASALSGRPNIWEKAQLTATSWEASRNLGVRNPTPVPTTRHVELLRWHDREGWVERLTILGLEPVVERRTRREIELTRRQQGHLTRL